jgi:hypothetical protein
MTNYFFVYSNTFLYMTMYFFIVKKINAIFLVNACKNDIFNNLLNENQSKNNAHPYFLTGTPKQSNVAT